ncbi:MULTISPECIES: acetolactate synthase small subunit [Methanohalophilus]|jgi:acetolactate synthase-1/3 small subunit|uniref:Acetolactate synthase small subunit n=1 Tax=Methanohalophilus euhalobius TaxID=51203 RepID=A0A314ZZN8_9EURY|nr:MULTISPECIES: acetolactate synthase small subunit [Methanohalophilus]KXS46898.1 MAG: acetolactate synthase I/III small subunit [Methanohalophilus sp. T328-1]RSD33994.1 MAG: acetolactate synthase I/III small subunit [Methanohalophilus sp.]OBZ34479.1 MAG: acetolactate synthase small subunit [Methanohalophilus sp. DAL1]PQV42674.1 acetolactate synthase small subunit [Methanohalophilus euhalobius]RNI08700.1 acetolactate synthase small subunit [Methanohalophilus euhalobius]
MRHTLAVLVENKFGVLSRVAGLFARRGYNIDSLAVGVTENPNVSRMTLVVRGDDHVVEQVSKQLNKLIDVIRVTDLDADESVERELALIKVKSDKDTRAEIIQIVDIFRARIVDVASKSIIIEVTGDEEKIAAIEKLLKPFGIKELVRTGRIALTRGSKNS